MPRAKVFELMYDKPDPDYEILMDRMKKQPEEFWKTVNHYMKHGGAVSDKHGHSREIRVNVYPQVFNLIQSWREKYPNWYGSQAAATRAIFNIGLKFAIAIGPENGQRDGLTSLEKSLKRLDTLLRPIGKLDEGSVLRDRKMQILSSDLPEREKAKRIAEIDETIKEIYDDMETME